MRVGSRKFFAAIIPVAALLIVATSVSVTLGAWSVHNPFEGSGTPKSASVPHVLPFQGRLSDPSTGAPFTGSKTVIFGIFDAPAGGTQVWTETQTLTLDANGFFDTMLGTVNPVPALSDPAYLQMTVDLETLSPRTRIGASAFALSSADGVPSGTSIVTDSPVPPQGYTLAGTVPVGDQWYGKSRMQTPRGYAATASVGAKLYVIGGTDDQGVATNLVEEYDPTTDSWTTKAPMPTARYNLAAAAVNGKIYAIGGLAQPNEYATVEEYDPATDTWTTKTPMPTIRYGLGAAVVNGKVYAIGGHGTGPDVATVEEYDPPTDSWTTKAPMPAARRDLGVAAVNDKIYAIGGTSYTEVFEYTPSTNTWISRAPKLLNGSTSAVESNGHIFAFTNATGQFEEYDPADNSWQSRAHPPELAVGLVLGVANGRIYAVVGYNQFNANQEYVPLTTYYLHKKD